MQLFILDACVLIDFFDADASILTVMGEALGPIHVPLPALDKGEGLDPSAAQSMGLKAVEPTFSEFAAAAERRGRLSIRDALCLLLAKSNGWTCVSNDRALRNACEAENVPVLWGLEMLGLAVETGAVPVRTAEDVAWRIAEMNPMITEATVNRFLARSSAAG